MAMVRGSSLTSRGGLLCLASGSGLRCCPLPASTPVGSWVVLHGVYADSVGGPLFKWMAGPLSVGGKLASELPPFLAPEPPALPSAFLQGLETTSTPSR